MYVLQSSEIHMLIFQPFPFQRFPPLFTQMSAWVLETHTSPGHRPLQLQETLVPTTNMTWL